MGPASPLLTRVTVFCALVAICASQLPYPLQGQEGPGAPSLVSNVTGKPTALEISTKALLERVLAFNTLENTYEAVWWVVLVWRDPEAGKLVAARTAETLSGGAGCERPCDGTTLPSSGCCDNIWLPHITLPNIVGYMDDQLPRYRINANATSGLVTWSTRLVGKWYAPLDFRAYPFDHQHILLELAIADSQAPVAALQWDHVAKLNNTAHTKAGADLSGWRIMWGKGKVYDSRTCYQKYDVTAPLYTAGPDLGGGTGDLPSAVYQSIALGNRSFASNQGRGTTIPRNCGSYPTVYDEGQALYGPVVLVADIMIKRVASYFVMANLIPVIIISLVVFVVYYMPCNALGDRMVLVMTLFLSLTAMQFVFEFPPANYLNALQQVVLVAYVNMLIACIESLIVNRITVLSQHLSNTRGILRKYSTLFRRLRISKQAAAVLASQQDSPLRDAGTPRTRTLPRVASLPRPVSRRGIPPATTTTAATSKCLARVRTQQCPPLPMSRFASSSATGAANSAAAAAAAASALAAAGAGVVLSTPPLPANLSVTVVSVCGSECAAETSARKDSPSQTSGQKDSPSQTSGRKDSPSQTRAATNLVCQSSSRPPSVTCASGGQSPLAHSQALAEDHRLHVHSNALFGDADDSSTRSDGSAAPCGPRSGSRCCDLWASTAAFGRRVWSSCVAAVHAPGNLYQHCREDADFAWFVACRIDKWCCLVSLVLYTVCVGVLLWVQTEVGDHKLMLGDQPGNM